MTRPWALVLSIVVMLAVAPAADAHKRRGHSHVLACAAVVGAPCQARLNDVNASAAFARLVLLKETNRWH